MNPEVKEQRAVEEEEFSAADPLCPVYGTCGGCRYQHLEYRDELKIKRRQLKSLLGLEAGIDEELVEEVVPSPRPYGSRSRLDLTLLRIRSGETFLGFMPPRSKRIVEIESCPIARPEISSFIPALKEAASARLPSDYRTANLVVRTGDEGKVRWGGIGRRSLRMDPADYFWTEIRGRRIYYSLENFFQANLSILPAVVGCIESLVPSHCRRLFLDIYAGVGLFGIALSDLFERIVMLEENPASVKLASYNIEKHRFGHVSVLHGRAEERMHDVLKEAPGENAVAMIDPPRKGMSPDAMNSLLKAEGLERLFYLSCNPESLARDLRVLGENRWTVAKVIPFDFFPKTRHLETLVLLEPPR